MARGSVLWRCGKCRKTWQTKPAECPHKGAGYYFVYRHLGIQKWEAAGANRKDAEKRLGEVLSQINNGAYHKPTDILFKDFAKKWVEEHAKTSVKGSTLRSYESIINIHLLPAFGNLPLTQITVQKILSFKAEVLKERSPKTFNNILVLLTSMLRHAKKWKYIKENPTEDLERARIEHKEMDFLQPAEIKLLLDKAEEPYRTLFMTAVLTGMRRGELLGLQWGDIDWNSNQIFVKRGLFWSDSDEENDSQEQRWSFVSPKSKHSIRTIVMSPKLREALQIHKIKAPISPYDLVFCTGQGNPLDPDNMIHREFQPTLVRAELRRIRFHDLRHTYTTLLVSQGENIKFIQTQLGHASIQTTLDRYGHLLPNIQEGVGSRLDGQIFNAERPRKEKVLAPR